VTRPRAGDGTTSGSKAGASPESRELEDLRLALSVITTYWAAKHGRKLHAADVLPFRRAQTWHTYSPVEVASAERVTEIPLATETWSDYGTAGGRFTALRTSPLLGQTFEIAVAAGTASGRPVFQRGYVTITRLVTRDDESALREYFDELEDGLDRFGRDEPRAVPEGGEPLLGFDLTRHELAGREAQRAFWGYGAIVDKSMLHQLAIAVAGR